MNNEKIGSKIDNCCCSSLDCYWYHLLRRNMSGSRSKLESGYQSIDLILAKGLGLVLDQSYMAWNLFGLFGCLGCFGCFVKIKLVSSYFAELIVGLKGLNQLTQLECELSSLDHFDYKADNRDSFLA